MNGGRDDLDILGVGNAIVDIFSHEDDEFLDTHGMPKSSMSLIDAERSAFLYGNMTPVAMMSGGSVANTIAHASLLGAAATFVGKVAADEFGETFTAHIQATGVTFETSTSSGATGTARSLIVVTPDGHRTMNTYLGACLELTPADIDPGVIRRAKVTCVEGYLFDSPGGKAAVLAAADAARAAGNRVALTLSDSFCVERHREEFLDFIERYAGVVFGNEDEVRALCETTSLQGAVDRLRRPDLVAAVTLGGKGSLVLASDAVVEVPAEPVARLVDTTGAGDAYAAGFLHGLIKGSDPAGCARTGSTAAAAVISHLGSHPQTGLTAR